MAQQLKEVEAIADDPAAPTFDNTLVAMEKTGQLLDRVMEVFNCVTGANTDPTLQKVQEYEAPRLAAAHGRNLSSTPSFCAREGDLRKARIAGSRSRIAAAGGV